MAQEKKTKSAARPAVVSPASDRLARFTRLVADSGVPQFLVTNPVDVGYLTGFMGGDSYLLITGSRPIVISDFRYQEELEVVRDLCDVHIRKGSIARAAAELIMETGAARVGVQGEHMTLGLRQSIGLGIRGIKLIETTDLCSRLRIKKDASELKLIRKSIEVQEESLEAMLKWLDKRLSKQPGVTETEIAAVLEHEMKSRGSSKPGFETIIAAGTTGSLPHYRPQTRVLKKGMSLLVDWGAIYRGYHSDMTRVFCWGKWPSKVAEIYQIVLDAHEAAAAALKPGMTTKQVDSIAREYIAKHGFGEFFGHGLGHGMGLDGHEEPRLSHLLDATTLDAGMVVTIEPGIYLPGVGGVRIEDDYLVTSKGAENLCSLPKSLKWASR